MKRKLGAGLLVMATSVALAASPATAENGFVGSASAAGVRWTITAANAPGTPTPVDVGGPLAQAAVDSAGGSQGFASFPFPGDIGVAAPGLLAGAVGVVAPGTPGLPDTRYPFYVRSDPAVQPKDSRSYGASTLSATSTPTSSEASAVGGIVVPDVSIGAVTSRAAVRVDAERVVHSDAGATVDTIETGALRIGKVSSAASVVGRPDGTLERTSSLVVTGLSIAGHEFIFGPKGISTPGGNLAVPDLTANQIEALLAQAGFRITYLAEERTASGVVGAGLSITQQRDAPGVGPTRVVWTVGQATANVVGSLAEAIGSTPPTPGLSTTGPEEPVVDTSESPAADPTADSAAVIPALPGATSFTPPPSPEPAQASLGGAAAPTPGVTPPAAVGLVTTPNAFSLPVSKLYLTVLLAGAACIVMFQLIRIVAVRSPWNA